MAFLLWAGTGIILFASRLLGGSQTNTGWIPITLAAVVAGIACIALIFAALAMINQRKRVRERLRIYGASPEVVETHWNGRTWFSMTEHEDGEPHENPVDLYISPGHNEPWIVIWRHNRDALQRIASAGRIVTTDDGYVIVDLELNSAPLQPHILTAEYEEDWDDDYSHEEWSLVQVFAEDQVRPEHRNAVLRHLASLADEP